MSIIGRFGTNSITCISHIFRNCESHVGFFFVGATLSPIQCQGTTSGCGAYNVVSIFDRSFYLVVIKGNIFEFNLHALDGEGSPECPSIFSFQRIAERYDIPVELNICKSHFFPSCGLGICIKMKDTAVGICRIGMRIGIARHRECIIGKDKILKS